jgi:cysteine desulfurase
MREVYLDNAATTKVDERVFKEMSRYFSLEYANASSSHVKGIEAKRALERARKIIANSINALPEEIYFTSGGTESNNLALKGLFFSQGKDKNHIITTNVEHNCIQNTCKWLETQGAKVTYLKVNKKGFVNLEELEKIITSKSLVVSIIHGNNEIGTIQNLRTIGEICKKKGVLFHTDACQSYSKVEIDVKKMNLDLVTLNSHKIHGPKGVGALYIKKGIKITPLLHGGNHEGGIRSGTENVSGIVGFAKAVSIANKGDIRKMERLRNKIIEELLKIPNVKLNGANPLEGEERLCNNINVSFGNIEGESIGGYLEDSGIYTSTGSACLSHNLKKSHVLEAIGLNPMEVNSSLRISISKFTSEKDVVYFLNNLKKVVYRLRKISPFK